jgi:hypothetical protein
MRELGTRGAGMKRNDLMHVRHQSIKELADKGYKAPLIAAVTGWSEALVQWHLKREKARQAQSFAAPLDKDRLIGEVVQ